MNSSRSEKLSKQTLIQCADDASIARHAITLFWFEEQK